MLAYFCLEQSSILRVFATATAVCYTGDLDNKQQSFFIYLPPTYYSLLQDSIDLESWCFIIAHASLVYRLLSKKGVKMVHIIAHRGEWSSNVSPMLEPNSFEAFTAGLKDGFGIEVDIRDYKGELCISHNPVSANPFWLRSLLEFYSQHQLNTCIAFNVKADGLQSMLQKELTRYRIEKYFTFDMSIPNTIVDVQANLQYFLRQSEFELYPQKLGFLYHKCKGIWIDQFELNDKILEHNLGSITTHLNNRKQICWVSPELHPWGRQEQYYLNVWAELRQILNKSGSQDIYLCTDYPKQAEEYFNAKN